MKYSTEQVGFKLLRGLNNPLLSHTTIYHGTLIVSQGGYFPTACQAPIMLGSKNKKIIGVIPARISSTRLPRKPLLLIHGHPMIAWVCAHARAATELSELLVATDSDEILEWCRSLNIPVMMTSPAHRSGTERICEVMSRQVREGSAADIYVNIQCDEPLVETAHIKLLVKPFTEDAATQVSTLKVRLDRAEAANPHKVKVVVNHRGDALYFSRSPMPHDSGEPAPAAYYKHLGLYAYSRVTLEKYKNLRPGPLEAAERLEQLRFLENGVPVAVRETTKDTIAVDTAEDLERVEQHFTAAGLTFPG
ncbi:MAG: 3-deoxy-manno-octulosonate cytidylyltransferase [Terriglobia bacterium]